MSKRNKRSSETPRETTKTIRADKLMCGDMVKVANSWLEATDVTQSDETIVVTLRLQRGGEIERTYHVNEPIEIENAEWG